MSGSGRKSRSSTSGRATPARAPAPTTTPTKNSVEAALALAARVLKTPNKDQVQPGIPRTVFTHVSTLQGLMNDWLRMQTKGTTICKTIAALRLHEMMQGEYPDQLTSLVDCLVEALQGLQSVVESLQTVDSQLGAVAKLQPSEEPVINTWSASKISREVHEIRLAYEQELDLKRCIVENLAHCRDERLTEVYVSAWELEAYVTIEEAGYLFADLGLVTEVT